MEFEKCSAVVSSEITGVELSVRMLFYDVQYSPLNSGSVNSEILLIQTGDYSPG